MQKTRLIQQPASFRPEKGKQRLEGLDLARFVAFAGMVMVNFKIVMGVSGEHILSTMLEGKAAATFVVLAGIGLGMSASNRTGLVMTIKRALFLFAAGLLNMLVFDADILHYYAFYFLIGVLFLKASDRLLIHAIIGLNVLFILLYFSLDYDQGWDWQALAYEDFWSIPGFVRHLMFNGWHPLIPWLGFLLFGILLSRLPLSEKATQQRLMAGGLLALISAEILSRGLTPLISTGFVPIFSTNPIPPMPLYSLTGLGAACFIAGLCLLIADKAGPVLLILAPAGRQTLTLYIAHIYLGMGALEELGLMEGQRFSDALAAGMLFCLFCVVFSCLWSRRFKNGPLEMLMRKVTG